MIPKSMTLRICNRSNARKNCSCMRNGHQNPSASGRAKEVCLEFAMRKILLEAGLTRSVLYQQANSVHLLVNLMHVRTFSSSRSAEQTALHATIDLRRRRSSRGHRRTSDKPFTGKATKDTLVSTCDAESTSLKSNVMSRGSTNQTFPETSMPCGQFNPTREMLSGIWQ